MNRAAFELQKAVFATLSADAGLVGALGGARLHDLAPAHTPYPYVTFGPASTFDWSTGTEQGSEHFFTLHIWSNARGRAEALDLMERIEARLSSAPPAPAGFRLINLRSEGAELRYDEDLSVHHGTLRWRAVMEPL